MKYFIIADSLDIYLNYVIKYKLNPLKVFHCQTLREATNDALLNFPRGAILNANEDQDPATARVPSFLQVRYY